MHITIASMDANGEISAHVLAAAKSADSVVLQSDIPNALKEAHIKYETLDPIFESAVDFDDLLAAAADFLMRENLLFIALGDICSNMIAAKLTSRVKQSGGSITIIPVGDAALCLAMENGIADGTKGVCIFTAASFDKIYDTDTVLVINELGSRLAASELKLKLSKYYGDTYEMFCADLHEKKGKIIPLCMLDGEQSYGYYKSIVIPARPLEQKQRFMFSDLLAVMDILRSRNGCPWDNEQTHQSLKRYLIEESYEVLDAIDEHDMADLYDELGDVLLQVVFHAKIADQHGEFDISDVTTSICAKMISRHSHIFGSAVAATAEEVLNNWENIKKAEKSQQTQAQTLLSIPKSMPALMRSEKVQAKAARAGMDFPEISSAISKLYEEISEVKQGLSGGGDFADECGDLLFSAVNVLRHAGVEPETVLQKATDKFIARFFLAEKIADELNLDMHSCGLELLNEIWDRAKQGVSQ